MSTSEILAVYWTKLVFCPLCECRYVRVCVCVCVWSLMIALMVKWTFNIRLMIIMHHLHIMSKTYDKKVTMFALYRIYNQFCFIKIILYANIKSIAGNRNWRSFLKMYNVYSKWVLLEEHHQGGWLHSFRLMWCIYLMLKTKSENRNISPD